MSLFEPLAGETAVKIIHRHPFIAIKRIIFFILLLTIPLIIIVMINNLFPDLASAVWVWPTLLLGISGYLFFIWLLFFFSLVDYFLDIWIVTNQRIIDVRQQGFFSRSSSELRLNNIQDISSEIRGFLPTMLKYGNVIVETAGNQDKLFFEQVASPEQVRDLLMKLSGDSRGTKNNS